MTKLAHTKSVEVLETATDNCKFQTGDMFGDYVIIGQFEGRLYATNNVDFIERVLGGGSVAVAELKDITVPFLLRYAARNEPNPHAEVLPSELSFGSFGEPVSDGTIANMLKPNPNDRPMTRLYNNMY